jgi:2-keto-4-pentenoate hydratase
MTPLKSAEAMNSELTPFERLSFEYIEVEVPTVELHVSIVRGWVADVRSFIADLRNAEGVTAGGNQVDNQSEVTR